MDLAIQKKLALVTAASEGIGFACAKMLAAEGVQVILSSRNERKLAQAKTNIQDGEIIDTITADLSIPDSVQQLLDRVIEQWEGVDILVYNVGGPSRGQFRDLSETDWDVAYKTIVANYRRLLQGLLPHMKQQHWGRVIAIASVSVKQPIADLLLSNTFRPALAAFNKSLSDNYAPYRITFNTICPGGILTRRINDVINSRAQQQGISFDQQAQMYLNEIPMGCFGSPDDVAHVVAFLASDKAGFITGTAIPVDGGITRSVT